jgi:tetratricopeptide (TPR) repeat protein
MLERMGLALLLLILSAAAAPHSLSDPPPAFMEVPQLTKGFDLMYEQRFVEARAQFADWERQHPDEPFVHAGVAATYLFEEFYRQGVLTSEFFLDDKKFLGGIDGKPDPVRLRGFQTAIAETRELARDRLKRDPKDAEALFCLTLAAGMESDSLTILQKRHLDGLKRMKEANDFARETLALRPDAIDVYVAPGSANYIIGCLSGPARFFLWFGGIHGDKALGMEEVSRTAEDGRYLKPFAKILLALAALREKQYPLAQRMLKELNQEFPESPLFAAEYAKILGRPIPATMQSRP